MAVIILPIIVTSALGLFLESYSLGVPVVYYALGFVGAMSTCYLIEKSIKQ